MELMQDSLSIIFLSSLRLLSLMLLIYVLMSWVIKDQTHPLFKFLKNLFNPILNPIRKILPPIFGIDFSVIILLMIIEIMRQIFLY